MSWAIKILRLSKKYSIGKTNITAAELINEKLKSFFSLGLIKKKLDFEVLNDEVLEKRTVLSNDQLCGTSEFYALKNINLQINAGERVGIVGPNGCGKSTLLKILSRIVSPTEGEFEYVGRLISLLEIGTGFHGDLSGRENIYLNGTIMGMTQTEIREKLDRIIEFSELGTMIDTPVKRYSSGMYVRLAFSVAAHLESEILIVDEVLAVGDADFQKKCTNKMLDLANHGRTLIFVSHNMEVINQICDRIIVMEHGTIISDTRNNAVASGDDTKKIVGNEIVSSQVWATSSAPLYQKLVRLNSVTIMDRNKVSRNAFDVTEDIFVEIIFEVLEETTPLNCHLKIFDDLGNFVAIAMDNHLVEGSSKNRCRYRQTCHIYSPLLNTGDYFVEIDFWTGQPTSQKPALAKTLGFSIADSNAPSGVRGDWPNEWPNCFIRPDLKWYVEEIKDV